MREPGYVDKPPSGAGRATAEKLKFSQAADVSTSCLFCCMWFKNQTRLNDKDANVNKTVARGNLAGVHSWPNCVKTQSVL
jgi:hypothetical protein